MQLTPGTSGVLHLLQYRNPPGILTLALAQTARESSTYLLARSPFSSLAASTERRARVSERSLPMLLMRFRGTCLAVIR